MNHLGLAVLDLEATTRFFTDALGWSQSGRDDSYPRTSVSDGQLRLTLWQVDHRLAVEAFNRRKNVGLHHLALELDCEARLDALAQSLALRPDVRIEFMPQLLGHGPRKHMMLLEPGGIRIELIWPGSP
jgi:lactoylglutathione lyase